MIIFLGMNSNMDIKKKLEETERTDKALITKIKNIKDTIGYLNDEIVSLAEKRIALSDDCCNAIFDELISTAKDENVKTHLKALRYSCRAIRCRERNLEIALNSNIANIEVGSIVTDIPYFNKYDNGNGCKIFVSEILSSLLSITTQNNIVTKITSQKVQWREL